MDNLYVALIRMAPAAIIWLIGGNLLIAFHYRRVGKPMDTGLKPFQFPFANFNLREWLTLFLLLAAALTWFVVAMPEPDDGRHPSNPSSVPG